MEKPPKFQQNRDADTSALEEDLGIKVAHGQMSSPEAQEYWRNTVLKNAHCPICGTAGLLQLHLRGHSQEDEQDQLAFGLPVIVPGRPDLVSVGAVQYASCPTCGYLAPFMDLAIIAAFEKSKTDG